MNMFSYKKCYILLAVLAHAHDVAENQVWKPGPTPTHFYMFSDQALPWKEASLECQNKGASLVIIGSPTELNWLQQWLPEVNNNRSTWVGLTLEDRQWRWIDARPLNTQILKFSPEDKQRAADCGEYVKDSGTIAHAPCEDIKCFICQSDGFQPKWNSGKLAWMDAYGNCTMAGENLMSISSLRHKKALLDSATRGQHSNCERAWIGLVNVRGSWKWVDQRQLDLRLMQWEKAQSEIEESKCAKTKRGQYLYNSLCTQTRPFVCEKIFPDSANETEPAESKRDSRAIMTGAIVVVILAAVIGAAVCLYIKHKKTLAKKKPEASAEQHLGVHYSNIDGNEKEEG